LALACAVLFCFHHSEPLHALSPLLFSFFFFNATPPTELYTLSLHDALPISLPCQGSALPLRQSPVAAPCGADGGGYGIRTRVHGDRKSTRLNSSHVSISYAVFCLKKKS